MQDILIAIMKYIRDGGRGQMNEWIKIFLNIASRIQLSQFQAMC